MPCVIRGDDLVPDPRADVGIALAEDDAGREAFVLGTSLVDFVLDQNWVCVRVPPPSFGFVL